MLSAAIISFAYILGSISSAIIICRIMSLPDPRTQGSNNPGASNVLRVGGRKPALLTLIADITKAALPITLGKILALEPLILGLIAVSACLGHIFPIFFHFHGGKGAATAFGGMLMLNWQITLILFIVWLLAVFATRYASAATLGATLSAPILVYFFDIQLLLPILFISCLLLIRHKSNIVKLLKGEEIKLSFR